MHKIQNTLKTNTNIRHRAAGHAVEWLPISVSVYQFAGVRFAGLRSAGLQSAFCRFSIGDPPQIPASLASLAWIFSHLFFMLLSNTFLETLWASQNEYSCELGPQNDSKMEPKIEEKSNFAKK